MDDKTIQAILRHSNIGITQNIYIKSVNKSQVSAMDTLERKPRNLGRPCNEWDRDNSVSPLSLCLLRGYWSRGRELNSRPADYEMSAFRLSLLFSISTLRRYSRPFATFRQSSVQRNVQRSSLVSRIET